MAQAGDLYTVTLKPSHIAWGTYRNTGTRGPVEGEAYLPIDRRHAEAFNIVNGNATNNRPILGRNLFNFRTADGYLSGQLRAQGSSEAGDIYAKQFSVNGDLKRLGEWYEHIGARVGTQISIEWISPYDIILAVL